MNCRSIRFWSMRCFMRFLPVSFKVLVLHKLGLLSSDATESVLRRFSCKWMLSKKLTKVMKDNVRYLRDTLQFSEANLRRLIAQNPAVLTSKMKTEEGNIANCLTRSFSVSVAELKMMVHTYPQLLTQHPTSPAKLKAWMKKVGQSSSSAFRFRIKPETVRRCF